MLTPSNIQVKKLNDSATIPKYATKGAACFDIYASEEVICLAGVNNIPTGLAFEIPDGCAMLIYSRSGLASRGYKLANCVGVIDSDYRGELIIMLQCAGSKRVEAGERIAQGMIVPCPQIDFILADELSETDRGAGGFGSTGTK